MIVGRGSPESGREDSGNECNLDRESFQESSSGILRNPNVQLIPSEYAFIRSAIELGVSSLSS